LFLFPGSYGDWLRSGWRNIVDDFGCTLVFKIKQPHFCCIVPCSYGDWLRSGWRNIVDVVLRLHRLDLLPPAVIAGEHRLGAGDVASTLQRAQVRKRGRLRACFPCTSEA